MCLWGPGGCRCGLDQPRPGSWGLATIQSAADDPGSYGQFLPPDQNFLFIQCLAFKAADLFRHGETYKMIERYSIRLRQVTCHISQRCCEAKRVGHTSFILSVHERAFSIHWVHQSHHMLRIVGHGLPFWIT
jgi:hypothetical protein